MVPVEVSGIAMLLSRRMHWLGKGMGGKGGTVTRRQPRMKNDVAVLLIGCMEFTHQDLFVKKTSKKAFFLIRIIDVSFQ